MALVAVVFFFLLASSTTSTTAELTVPVNKTCSNLTFQDPSTSSTLDIFFTALVAQSNSANFYHTIIVNTATTVDGLYNCSANLSQTDCQTCVKILTSIIPRSCDTATTKLVNCYMTYQLYRSQVIYSDGGEDYGVYIGAFVASVLATVVSILLQS